MNEWYLSGCQKLLDHAHPYSAAQRNQVVVEVVAGVVQGAWAAAVAHFAVLSFAVGDEEIGAWFFQQHIRKIFCAHGGLLRQHMVCTHDVGEH